MRLVGLQDFYFDLGYEAWLQGLFITLSWLSSCFGVQPLAITVFSFQSLEKDVGTQRGIGACTPTPRRWYDGLRARNSSKQIFVCWRFSLYIVLDTLLDHLHPNALQFHWNNVQLLCNFSLNFSNTINPLIWAGMNPLFRRDFRRIIICRQNGEKIGDTQQVSTEDATRRSNTLFQDQKQAVEVGDFGCRRTNENWWKK